MTEEKEAILPQHSRLTQSAAALDPLPLDHFVVLSGHDCRFRTIFTERFSALIRVVPLIPVADLLDEM